jgi:hyperosmotically inducible periplasmic protein
MTQIPPPGSQQAKNEKPQDQQQSSPAVEPNAAKRDQLSGMQGEDYNYGGASSVSAISGRTNGRLSETVGEPVKKSGPIPISRNPPGNYSDTEANWGNRTGSGLGGGMAAVEETGERHNELSRTDKQIAETVRNTLRDCAELKKSEIQVTAENGRITLKGSLPNSGDVRIADAVAKSIPGVDGVDNQIVACAATT